jgi:hypothetical protein
MRPAENGGHAAAGRSKPGYAEPRSRARRASPVDTSIAPPVKLSRSGLSFQFGRASAPMIPLRVQNHPRATGRDRRVSALAHRS